MEKKPLISLDAYNNMAEYYYKYVDTKPYNAYAGVTLPNIKSESLHESFGFREIGIYHNVGYKLGGWHDVKWYELKIQEHNNSPVEPKSIDEISTTSEFMQVIEKAEPMIKID